MRNVLNDNPINSWPASLNGLAFVLGVTTSLNSFCASEKWRQGIFVDAHVKRTILVIFIKSPPRLPTVLQWQIWQLWACNVNSGSRAPLCHFERSWQPLTGTRVTNMSTPVDSLSCIPRNVLSRARSSKEDPTCSFYSCLSWDCKGNRNGAKCLVTFLS